MQEIRVLDLGSGTGVWIAQHFINNDKMTWHALDISNNMSDVFKNTFRAAAKKIRMNTYVESIFNLSNLSEIMSNKFDIVVLSFTLSSLSKHPDFNIIKSLLKDDGILIIADSDEYLIQKRPLYDFELDDNKKVAIKPRKIDRMELFALLENQIKMRIYESVIINSANGKPYSFVLKVKLFPK